MRAFASTYPPPRSSYSSAVSGGSGSASARAAQPGPTLSQTLASMGSGMRKRWDALTARFKRSQTAKPAKPAGPSTGFLGGLFDPRGGQYSQLPATDGPLNPARREAFTELADERDDVEIELMSGGGSARAAGEPASAPTAAATWAASVNDGGGRSDPFSNGGGGGGRADPFSNGGGGRADPPGVVSANPVFAIGDEDEEDERTSLTSPKKHI
jgi:hypothetical protein